jgi:hypothetical protein
MPKGAPRPALNFPAPFLEPNTRTGLNMTGVESAGPGAPKKSYEAIPVETLIKSLTQESPLDPESLLPPSRPPASSGATPAMPSQR